MKKYLVIGNPIDHSMSPKLHNYWIKNNNIKAIYEKKKLDENEIESLILDIKSKKLNGINVTVPFKKAVISYLDQLSLEAESTQSVNTIYLDKEKSTILKSLLQGKEVKIKQKIKSELLKDIMQFFYLNHYNLQNITSHLIIESLRV